MVRFRYFSILVGLLFCVSTFAQQATVTAKNYDISDNLDLQAVASVFGDSKDLADFEFRLNDPEMRLSNLDLNRDGYVDYLRVIEAVEGKTHLIVIQAVLGQDVFQDVATIEVEKDRRNQVQVQVVGNSYIYGDNYIYEPVYVHTPSMFSFFWSSGYSPYRSSWYWNYYPTYYSYWQPYPVYTYIDHVHVHVNRNNRYVYATNRRSSRAVRMHREVRSNAYERDYPQNSFSNRNSNVSNRYALEQSRGVESGRNPSNSTSNRGQGVSSGRNVNRVNGDSGYRRGAATTEGNFNSSSRTSNRVQSSSDRGSSSRGTINSSSNSTVSPRATNSSRATSSPRATSSQRATNVSSNRVNNVSSQPARIQRSSTPMSNSTSRSSSTINRSSNTNFNSGRTSAPSSRGAGSTNTSSRGNGNSGRSSR
ncbi:hypothetical protein [Myroides guanonis]|uniref:EF-hand domain-containing protein n=1 Tax=Myroides guanonis TaxID=1150112 RepID=A0A1I3RKF5_9FLAO|nr:hypothetical protein [Myroides guanonis]SFJ45646.1 hypothetical protein SAMN04487893_10823 [Myroides guanonis]